MAMWNVLFTAVLASGSPSLDQVCENPKRSTPVYHHGFNPPVDLPCIGEEFAEDTFRKILEMREEWKAQMPGDEATVGAMPELKALLKRLDLHYFTLGATHNYMIATEVHALAERIDEKMQKAFSSLYEEVRKVLERHMREPVRFVNGRHLAFRIFSNEVIKTMEAQQVASRVHSSPHYDMIAENLDWPQGTRMNHTISFTLPIKLPPAGHGLKIYHAYYDSYNDVWVDMDLNPIEPISTDQAFQLDSHIHPYKTGVLALHSGFELHCIPPFNAPMYNEGEVYRITLQGWGIWTDDGYWNIFS
ncbi:hypothetical protein AAMO2058_001744600 [Amorphochlora amoebiformis]